MEKSTSRVWGDNELNILVDFVHNHQDIFINKMNNNIKPSEKRIKWLEVTELINSVGGKSRSSDEVQRKWADWKNRTNNKLQRINKFIKQSGEGALPKKMHLTELEERVIALVPHAKKFGIPGGIDQGPIAIPVEKDSIIEESQPDNYCNGIMVTDAEENCEKTDDKVPSVKSRKRKRNSNNDHNEVVSLTRQLLEQSVRRNDLLESIASSLITIINKNIANDVLSNLCPDFN